MLEAVPTDLFSHRFLLQDQNQVVGEMEMAFWSEKAQLELPDATYLLYREGWFSGDFLLERNGIVVARATKTSALRNTFEVQLPNGQAVFRKPSHWKRMFAVFDGDKELGNVSPRGWLTRRADIDLPADWPLATKAFLFWLAFLMWKRQNQATA